MVRAHILLDEDDKAWLDRQAREQGVALAELVRQAVRLLREQSPPRNVSLRRALEVTAGSWREGDGLAWQEKLRGEW
jgi:hypothetical protein